jgi:hypothetical protein
MLPGLCIRRNILATNGKVLRPTLENLCAEYFNEMLRKRCRNKEENRTEGTKKFVLLSKSAST